MGKSVIAIDIDEVLFPFTREFVKFHNSKYETTLSIDDFLTYEFEHVMDLPVDVAVSRIRAFDALEENIHVEPLQDAKKALNKLSEKYKLVIVTARDPKFGDATHAWIDKHFSGVFSQVMLIGHPTTMQAYRTKAEVCKELNAVALVDDSVVHVTKCIEEGVEGILFGDYPWSKANSLPKGAARCQDWQAVLEHFDEQA